MNNYYNNYLINSTCYSNLNKAIEKLETIKSNISELENTFEKASGNVIDIINKDLVDAIDNFNNYINELKKIQNTLKTNAHKFDSALNEWKGKIGSNYSEPVETSRPLDNTFKLIEYRTKYEIVDSVSISDRGYINVKVKSYIQNIVKNMEENTKTSSIEDVSYQVYEHGFNGIDDYK